MKKDIVNLLKLALLAVCALTVLGGAFYLWTGGHRLIAVAVCIVGVLGFIAWLKWFRKE